MNVLKLFQEFLSFKANQREIKVHKKWTLSSGQYYIRFPAFQKMTTADRESHETNGIGAWLSPGPAFFRHTGRCIDVDKMWTAINHRVAQEKKESFSRVYSSHGGSRQFAAVSLSPADNGSLSGSLCSLVERTRRLPNTNPRTHSRIIQKTAFLSLSLSLSLYLYLLLALVTLTSEYCE